MTFIVDVVSLLPSSWSLVVCGCSSGPGHSCSQCSVPQLPSEFGSPSVLLGTPPSELIGNLFFLWQDCWLSSLILSSADPEQLSVPQTTDGPANLLLLSINSSMFSDECLLGPYNVSPHLLKWGQAVTERLPALRGTLLHKLKLVFPVFDKRAIAADELVAEHLERLVVLRALKRRGCFQRNVLDTAGLQGPYEVLFVSKPISKSMFVNRSMFAM